MLANELPYFSCRLLKPFNLNVKKKDPKHLHNLAISHQYDRKVRRTQNPFRQEMI